MYLTGFGCNIDVYIIDVRTFDSTLYGKLLGHTSQISVMQVFDVENLLISISDVLIVRSWNQQSLKCLQIFKMITKVPSSKILDLKGTGRFSVITNRIILFKFEAFVDENKMDENNPYLSKIEFLQNDN